MTLPPINVWQGALLVAALVSANTVRSEPHPFRYVEAAFALYNPDWEAREDAMGLTVRGSLPLSERLRVSADLNLLETDPVGFTVQHVSGMPFKNWRSAGIGVFGSGPRSSIWALDLSLAAVDVAGHTENGGIVTISLQKAFENLDFSMGAGYVDLAIEDTVIELSLGVPINVHWAATARIRDYAEWDFTRYEIGVRWHPARDAR